VPAQDSHRAEESSTGGVSGRPVRALIVDDEPNIRQTLALCLKQMRCEVAQAATGAAAIDAIRERAYDLALVDLRLGAEDGIELRRSSSRCVPSWTS
jgi:DNA-binding response OmpR family regulator